MTLEGRDDVGGGDAFENSWLEDVRECRLDWDVRVIPMIIKFKRQRRHCERDVPCKPGTVRGMVNSLLFRGKSVKALRIIGYYVDSKRLLNATRLCSLVCTTNATE